MPSDYENDDYEDYEEDCGGCPDCDPDYEYDEDGDGNLINSYSYQPAPVFFHPNNKRTPYAEDGVPYFGMELEIGVVDRHEAASMLARASSELIYCKHDGSVNGIEAVTHPMTLEAAKEVIPFDTLTAMARRLGADATPHGIHIHVSRSGFSSDTHLFKWLKLIYRNQDDVSRIARRNSTEWAAFRQTDRQGHVLARTDKNKEAGYFERYSAINLQNAKTCEMRVFRGSLKKIEILAALELAAASIEYTRTLTTEKIRKGKGWEWATFMKWAASPRRQGRYSSLVEFNNQTAPQLTKTEKAAVTREKRNKIVDYTKAVRESQAQRRIERAAVRVREAERERSRAARNQELANDVAALAPDVLAEAVSRYNEYGYGHPAGTVSYHELVLDIAARIIADRNERATLEPYWQEATRQFELYVSTAGCPSETVESVRERETAYYARNLRQTARREAAANTTTYNVTTRNYYTLTDS